MSHGGLRWVANSGLWASGLLPSSFRLRALGYGLPALGFRLRASGSGLSASAFTAHTFLVLYVVVEAGFATVGPVAVVVVVDAGAFVEEAVEDVL